MFSKFGEEPIPQPGKQYPEDYTEEELKRDREEAGRRYAEKFDPPPKVHPEDFTEEDIRHIEAVRGRFVESYPKDADVMPLTPDEQEEAIRKAREVLANSPASEEAPNALDQRV